ncbi:MAG: hypothetical protein MUE81_05325 [Thermoflexibacter sp.]|nr:hypothetical protein [Thermoflexibacter sp.]
MGDPRRSNGIISLGFGPLKIGWDSEGIRHSLQNLFAHDFLSGGNNGFGYPWVPRTGTVDTAGNFQERRPRFFFQLFGF